MGSKHPMEVVNKLGACKFEFSVVLRHLIRNGTAKNASEAIRYLENNNVNIQDIIDEMTAPKSSITED